MPTKWNERKRKENTSRDGGSENGKGGASDSYGQYKKLESNYNKIQWTTTETRTTIWTWKRLFLPSKIAILHHQGNGKYGGTDHPTTFRWVTVSGERTVLYHGECSEMTIDKAQWLTTNECTIGTERIGSIRNAFVHIIHTDQSVSDVIRPPRDIWCTAR